MPASLFCKIMKSVHLIHFWVHAMSDTRVLPAAHQCQAPQKKLFQAINCSWQAFYARPVLVAQGCSTYICLILWQYVPIWVYHVRKCLDLLILPCWGPNETQQQCGVSPKTSGLAHRIIDAAETKEHEAQPHYIVPTDQWPFMKHWTWQLLRPKGLEITPSNHVQCIAVVELLLSYPFQTYHTTLHILDVPIRCAEVKKGLSFLTRFGSEGPEQAHFNLDCSPCGPGTVMCRGFYMARSEASRIRNRHA